MGVLEPFRSLTVQEAVPFAVANRAKPPSLVDLVFGINWIMAEADGFSGLEHAG